MYMLISADVTHPTLYCNNASLLHSTPSSPLRHGRRQATNRMLLPLLLPVLAWVSSSQSILGADLDDIKAQLRGVPRVEGLHVQAELSMLWTHNPAGAPHAAGTPEKRREELLGLGGGVTWAWDTTLCDDLLPKFREGAIVYNQLVTCEGVQAAVKRAFAKWESNSRFIKMVDMTAECNKLGINRGPPNADAQAGLYQDPSLPYHGGCPLAEIWVTSLARDYGGRRRLEETAPPMLHALLERRGGRLHEGDAFIVDHAARRLLEDEPSNGSLVITPQELGGSDIAVATARSYHKVTTNFRYTNGERPFTATNGTRNFARPFVEGYAGMLSIATHGSVGGVGVCWYLDSYFCSGFHSFKRYVGSPNDAKTLIMIGCYVVSGLAAVFLVAFELKLLLLLCGCGKDSCCGDENYKQKQHRRWSSVSQAEVHASRVSTRRGGQSAGSSVIRVSATVVEPEGSDDGGGGIGGASSIVGSRASIRTGSREPSVRVSSVSTRRGGGRGQPRLRCEEVLEEAAQINPLRLSVVVMLMVVPPMCFYHIVLPCWECADFEAAVSTRPPVPLPSQPQATPSPRPAHASALIPRTHPRSAHPR